MKFLSLCSGIDAASVASAPLGWECVGFSEIEPFPCAVLAHRYPSVTNYGDMTKYAEWPEQLFIDADAIVGGPPCQAFSMAGKREGLDDARGNLTLIYANLIDHADRIRRAHGKPPVWCLYENVPGLLSDRTNAFGCLLGKLAGEDVPLLPTGGKWTNAGAVFGPARSIAWRTLDAQYFGVAQRRRRVFVVASAGAVDPAKVLFESEGVRRDSAPSREAGKGIAPVAGTLSANGGGTTRPAGNCNELDFCIETYGCQGIGAYEESNLSATLLKTGQDLGNGYEAIVTHGVGVDCYNAFVTGDVAATFGANSGGTNNAGPKVLDRMAVRRLVPEECEALQGFPRGFTRIPWKNKPADECPDGPRYKSLGNSWAVPCARWIFERVKTLTYQ